MSANSNESPDEKSVFNTVPWVIGTKKREGMNEVGGERVRERVREREREFCIQQIA